jgi:Protein of unknown function (DUF3732)
MKIASIHIYSHDGRRRDLVFNPNGLNIITGLASTGKSSLSDIVEYCMGESDCKIAEGFILERVSWFGVIFQFPTEQVFVAKPNPKPGQVKCSLAMVRRGEKLEPPPHNDLKHDGGDELAQSVFSSLLGIPQTKTSVPERSSRESYAVNVKHTVYYLFQKQGLVASKDLLFYRQSEEYLPQTIRDTFAVLFGATHAGHIEAEAKRRTVQRDLKIAQKELRAAEEAESFAEARGLGLLAEAQSVGILPSGTSVAGIRESALLNALREVLAWKPNVPPLSDDALVSNLQRRRLSLRRELRRLQDRIVATRNYRADASAFEHEALEQRARLESINALPRNDAGTWQWPFLNESDARMNGIAEALQREIETLSNELTRVSVAHPRLEAHLAGLLNRANEVGEELRQVEERLVATISSEEQAAAQEDANLRAAHVRGRVSLYLDSIKSNETLPTLRLKVQELIESLKSWTALAGSDEEADARLASITTNVSTTLTELVREFKAYFHEFQFRFDLNKLTLMVERPGDPVPMNRTGGGANWLAYHISALLALHEYAAKTNRPIPRFLMLDQPTQVYFPSQKIYESVGGDAQKTQAVDADLAAARRLFEILLHFTTKRVPGFQLIVTEHANLLDPWFQQALVEPPWSNPPALVPLNWPTKE